MAAKAKITPELEKEMLSKLGEGLSPDAISRWLREERGCIISGRAIRERVRGVREERRDAVQAVTGAALVKVVLSDLDVLAKERRRLRRLAAKIFRLAMTESDGAVNGEAVELYLKAYDRINKLIETRLRFAGADGAVGAKRSEEGIDLDMSRLEPSELQQHFAIMAKAAKTESERQRYEQAYVAMLPRVH